MARIRTIKPEFWTDEKLAPLSPLTRLTFLGLVSMADDAGRLNDSVKLLDGLLFSETNDSVASSLDELERLGLIQRGTSANGKKILQIVGWLKHQKIEKVNLKSALPEISRGNVGEYSGKCRGGVVEASGTSLGSVADMSPPGSTIYDQRSTTNDLGSTIVSQQETFPRKVADDPPTEEDVAHYIASIGKDTSEAQKFCDYYAANGWVQGSEGKPIKDWQAQVRIWFSNEQARNRSSRNKDGKREVAF